ncbi:MAG TPA: protein-glutamate O-methyltransferase CheR [Vicinamibacterales bacterium]|nr:protein-glutamate O-methyltransferase CheR [Vicinamibacterales bacterium]
MFDTPRGVDVIPAARDDGDGIAPQVWCDLILRRCGLAFRHTRLADVIAAIRHQMSAHGVSTEGEFYRLLTKPDAGAAEWDALIERLINHETSFFRHPPSFDALRHHILPELRDRRGRSGRLNFWSAGCSTGQEAYSIAMVAMADDTLRGEFAVWGGDISRLAIEVARRGRYGPRAVASIPDGYRQRFLRPDAAEFAIVDEVRSRVRFMATNLVGGDGFTATHDVIFCHNVLIYFSPAAVSQAVNLLASRLTLGGYLLLGPGEAPAERPHGLTPVTIAGVRAFQRRGARPIEVRP